MDGRMLEWVKIDFMAVFSGIGCADHISGTGFDKNYTTLARVYNSLVEVHKNPSVFVVTAGINIIKLPSSYNPLHERLSANATKLRERQSGHADKSFSASRPQATFQSTRQRGAIAAEGLFPPVSSAHALPPPLSLSLLSTTSPPAVGWRRRPWRFWAPPDESGWSASSRLGGGVIVFFWQKIGEFGTSIGGKRLHRRPWFAPGKRLRRDSLIGGLHSRGANPGLGVSANLPKFGKFRALTGRNRGRRAKYPPGVPGACRGVFRGFREFRFAAAGIRFAGIVQPGDPSVRIQALLASFAVQILILASKTSDQPPGRAPSPDTAENGDSPGQGGGKTNRLQGDRESVFPPARPDSAGLGCWRGYWVCFGGYSGVGSGGDRQGRPSFSPPHRGSRPPQPNGNQTRFSVRPGHAGRRG